MFKYIYVFTYLLVTNIAFANKIIGHPTPFQSEMINPIELNCGLVIREIQNTNQDYTILNKMCTSAYVNFFKYIKLKNLKVNNLKHFNWNISFLNESTCYRCLNDEKYRFKNRFISGEVIGYTSKNDHWIFITSTNDSEFNVTFMHELFHSMSMFYGIYDNHHGSWVRKTEIDEILAQEFTEWLGYGR